MTCTVMVFTDGANAPGERDGWGGPYEGYSTPSSEEQAAEAVLDFSQNNSLTSKQEEVTDRHISVYKEQVEAAYKYFGKVEDDEMDTTSTGSKNGLLRLVVSHSMKDSFTMPMASRFFSNVLDWEKHNSFTVAHETHRKRFLYSPWVTRDFFNQYPEIKNKIKLCADLSHWVNPKPKPNPHSNSNTSPKTQTLTLILQGKRCRDKHKGLCFV